MNHAMKNLNKTLDKTQDHLHSAAKMSKHRLSGEAKKMHDVQIVIPPKKSGLAKTLLLPLTAAAVALLLAPKSGRELRADLKHKAMNMKDSGMDKVHSLTDEFKDTYEEVSYEMDEADTDPVADLISEVAQIPDASDDPAAGVGNVHGTPFEPTGDETVPADKLEEALADQHVTSEEELEV